MLLKLTLNKLSTLTEMDIHVRAMRVRAVHVRAMRVRAIHVRAIHVRAMHVRVIHVRAMHVRAIHVYVQYGNTCLTVSSLVEQIHFPPPSPL